MPGGRPPKPTALKILQGTARRDRLNPDEPQPPLLVEARPPSWLKGRARKGWQELAPVLLEMRVLTVGDRAALGLLCDAYGEYLELRETVRRVGRTYTMITESGSEMVMARPEVNMMTDAWRRSMAAMQQFGLTPSSRSKVSAKEAEQRDPFEDFLAQRR